MMITVTRLNGSNVMINALLIETIDEAADTIITLTTGNKLVVKERAVQISELCQQYLREIGYIALARTSKDEEGL
ncbi:flagellar FlbD family protein [Paenibacillus yanchengensis]|uniref:Flagellar FlbD family protein n=1 Tax=Paenibacillus yanchengensis TaxID=2035833 RepID=A0ABW4YMD7_9BACL